jgi:hypothetical protein
VSFLGKARRFLIPHEILKLAPGLLGGSFFHSFTCSLVHWFTHLLTVHSFHSYLSLIHPSSSVSWLGERETNCRRVAMVLLVVVVIGVIQP